MKEDKKETGEELLDIDEKDNPIKDQKEQAEKENKSKSNSTTKIMLTIIVCLIILTCCCYFFFNKRKTTKSIFDETTLKNLKLKNGVFFGPISHTVKRIESVVKNDVALVITEGAVVSDYSESKFHIEGSFRIGDDKYIPEIKELVDITHKYNSYLILDLVHQGLISEQEPAYSPSGDKCLVNQEIQSKEMTKEDILRIENDFVQGAIRAKKAGVDGIEIHGAQLNLISLFSTKKFNRRTDEYGGSDENRARFILEITKKIRAAIGNDIILSAKIDGPGEDLGITESSFFYIVKALEEAGLDLNEISAQFASKKGDKPYFYEPTKKVAEILKIPVICIKGIKKYEKAD